MGVRELEARILQELREVSGNKKLRQKDITEWSNGQIKPEEGETLYHLPRLGLNVTVKVLPRWKNSKQNPLTRFNTSDPIRIGTSETDNPMYWQGILLVDEDPGNRLYKTERPDGTTRIMSGRVRPFDVPIALKAAFVISDTPEGRNAYCQGVFAALGLEVVIDLGHSDESEAGWLYVKAFVEGVWRDGIVYWEVE